MQYAICTSVQFIMSPHEVRTDYAGPIHFASQVTITDCYSLADASLLHQLHRQRASVDQARNCTQNAQRTLIERSAHHYSSFPFPSSYLDRDTPTPPFLVFSFIIFLPFFCSGILVFPSLSTHLQPSPLPSLLIHYGYFFFRFPHFFWEMSRCLLHFDFF